MWRPFILVMIFVGLLAAGAPTAFADNPPLQAMLAAPQLTIAGQVLSVDELNSFYNARAWRPAWTFAGPENAKAFDAFLDSITQLIAYHGLQPQDYPIEAMRKLATASDDDSKNQLELLVTDSLLTLAHDLHGDSIDLAKLYDGWNFHRDDADIPAPLAAAVANHQLDAFMDALTPKNAAYMQLAKTLKTYREIQSKGGWGKIDSGPTIRPGDKGPRIAQIRIRLIAEDYLPAQNLPPDQATTYDAGLQDAVKTYQLRNGLEADGNIGAKSVDMMNMTAQDRIDQIEANMERWRHMPDSFPPDSFVLVNIPSATVDIVEDNKPVYRGIVIVGRVDRRTPFIQSVIRSMIINPVWHVPVKIARKDILPKLRKDPHYLEKLGFTIADRANDPYGESVDWKNMRASNFDFTLHQSPGDMNSLGRLKFDFNNDFSVYMHGTPHQELFKKNERNLSSGCIRLRDPLMVAELLLAGNLGPDHKPAWDSAKIEDRINSGKTQWVGLQKPVAIFVVYWTVFNDEAGKVNFRADPYGYDSSLIENMKSDDKMAHYPAP